MTKRFLVAVACLALLIGLALWSSRLLGTRYAIGFSESKFDQIVAGMTTDQVELILGKPLSKFPWIDRGTGYEYWSYSISPLGFGYEIRAVLFQEERVKEKRREYTDD